MGCDIHMVIERNIDGRWITWRTFGGHNLPAKVEWIIGRTDAGCFATATCH